MNNSDTGDLQEVLEINSNLGSAHAQLCNVLALLDRVE